jgi:hypothetical protein
MPNCVMASVYDEPFASQPYIPHAYPLKHLTDQEFISLRSAKGNL